MTWWMWVIIIFIVLAFFGKETEKQKQAKTEKERLEKEERQKKELLRQQHRDANEQTTPYIHDTGKHVNESSMPVEYNPLTQEYSRLKRVLEEKNSKKLNLSDELSWLDRIDISKCYSTLEYEESSKNKLQIEIIHIEKETRELQTKIHGTKKHIGTIFNPLNWLNNEQKAYRNKLDNLENELNVTQESNECKKKELSNIEQSINKINEDIKKHRNLNKQSVNDELNHINRELDSLEEDLKRIADLKNKVDIDLQVVLAQIKDYKFKISIAEKNIRKAKSFGYELDNARSSRERKVIHQNCEYTFSGEGDPRKIIRQQEGLIRKHERDMEKTKERAAQIGEKAARDIKEIVIDGNNMCYECGSFVGLKPLINLTNEMQINYKVTIVFDSAIRSQLKANDKIIREQFNKNIKVHVVATKQLADETILELASNNISYYILSNDRYGEYTEKEVIKSNRVIRHEIVDGKVIIHDLHINIRYS